MKKIDLIDVPVEALIDCIVWENNHDMKKYCEKNLDPSCDFMVALNKAIKSKEKSDKEERDYLTWRGRTRGY